MGLGANDLVSGGLESPFTTRAFATFSFLASRGASGGEVNFPAVAANVTAVGGRFLPLDAAGARTGEETAWSGSGGGLSLYSGRPSYQALTTIGGVAFGDHRAVPDVAYNADPFSGVAIYSKTPDVFGQTGWAPAGGTSAS